MTLLYRFHLANPANRPYTHRFCGVAEDLRLCRVERGGEDAGGDVQWQAIWIQIIHAQRAISPPAISVVTIASSLRRSPMIPTMPKTKAAGNENIISNAPSVAKGLLQPGLHRSDRTSVAPAMPSRAADILPKRIIIDRSVIVVIL